MKKILLFFVVVLALGILIGCGAEAIVPETPVIENSSDNEQPEEITPVDLVALRQNIIDALGISDPLLLETSSLMDLYGISEGSVQQSACFVTMSGTFPDEVILVEAADAASASEIAEKLQARLDEVMVQSKTYDADNYAAAQKCCVTRKDLFVTLILSPKQAEIAEICSAIIE